MIEPQADSIEAPGPEPEPAPPGPPCQFLRFNGMFVFTDSASSEDDYGYDSTIFWCQKTLKDFGPDEGFVGRQDCCDTSRSCYQPS